MDETSNPAKVGTSTARDENDLGGATTRDLDEALKLRITDVEKRFETRTGSHQALDGVTFDVKDGEFVCVVGPSGCGKTTLFRIIAGLEAPTTGTVTLDGHQIKGPAPDRGMVFQDHRLFPWRTAAGNVRFGLEQQAIEEETIDTRTHEMLELVGLADSATQYPHELSGGMRQRIGIARALAVDPAILLLDEPFASVDAQTRAELHRSLLTIWQETEKTVLFITHDVSEAVTLADRVVVLDGRPGRIRAALPITIDRPRSRADDRVVAAERQLRELIGNQP